MFEILIRHGANVNAIHLYGITPLHYAIFERNEKHLIFAFVLVSLFRARKCH